MKVVRKGYEKEIICPRCKSLLLYTNRDIRLVGDMESNYNYCVKCPECKNQINVNVGDGKENEFKKELNKYREHYISVKQCGEQIDLRDIEIVAEHFYELGFKAKEE